MSFLQERYRLLKLIGQGEFNKIFLAVDEAQFPVVRCVVEELSLQIVGFERRVQVLKEIGKHPQIAAIIAYFQEEGQFYLVQEFIEGSNLASVLSDEGVFSESQIWRLLENLLGRVEGGYYASPLSVRSGRATFMASGSRYS